MTIQKARALGGLCPECYRLKSTKTSHLRAKILQALAGVAAIIVGLLLHLVVDLSGLEITFFRVIPLLTAGGYVAQALGALAIITCPFARGSTE